MERETSRGSPRCSRSVSGFERRSVHTLESASGPFVCTNTTLWANLMQHIRTPVAAVSHIRSILDLMASIFSHVGPSYELLMLFKIHVRQFKYKRRVHPFRDRIPQAHLPKRAAKGSRACTGSAEGYGQTYIHLTTKGYTLAAVCTTLFTTAASSCGFSIIDFKVSKTIKLIVSFCCGGIEGLANVSARKSETHLRNSTLAPGAAIGRIPCMIWG